MSLNSAIKSKLISSFPSPGKSEKTIDHSINKTARKSFAEQSKNFNSSDDILELNKNFTGIFSKTVDGGNLNSTSIGILDPINFDEMSLNATAIKSENISLVPSPEKSEKTIDPSIDKSARKSFAKQSINYKSTNDFQELNKNSTNIFSKIVDGKNLKSTSIGMDPIKFNEMSLNAAAIKPKRISFVPSPARSEKTIDPSINKSARESFAKQSINYKSTNDFQELNKNFTGIFSKTVDGGNLNSTSIGMDPIKFNEMSLNATAIKPKRISFVPSPVKSEKNIDHSISKPARKSFAGLSIYYKSTNDFEELNKNFTDIFSKTVDGDNLNSTSIGIGTADFEPAINTFRENLNIKKNIMTKAYALSGFSMYKSILKDVILILKFIQITSQLS